MTLGRSCVARNTLTNVNTGNGNLKFYFTLLIFVQNISPGCVETEFFDVGSWQCVDLNKIPHLAPTEVATAVHYALDTPPGTQVRECLSTVVRTHLTVPKGSATLNLISYFGM